jgi:Tfp pilus assembly protein PilF
MNSKHRIVFSLRALAAACATVLALAAGPARAAPYLPQAGTEVLETLPRRADPVQQELQGMRRRLAAAPQDVQLAAALAQRYIGIGRSEADPRYFGYAQAALAPWWNQAAPPPAVRLLRATLLQGTHRFPAAMADLDAVTAADPANAQAWLTRATVQTVLGQYGPATASCARLSALAGELASITCLTNVSGLTGRLLKSDMLLAATLARSAGAEPALQAWTLTQLAEMATRRGNARLAEARYQAALRLTPRDSYLLGAYADFLLDSRRPAEAAALLKDQRRVDGLLLRYALALKQQDGRSPGQARDPNAATTAALAEAVLELQARFDAAALRGDSIHQREHARYELHLRSNAKAALALAQQNWNVQKEPADLRILLEAAQQAGDRAAAAAALAWLAQTGLEDAAIRPLAAQLSAQPGTPPATATATAAAAAATPPARSAAAPVAAPPAARSAVSAVTPAARHAAATLALRGQP